MLQCSKKMVFFFFSCCLLTVCRPSLVLGPTGLPVSSLNSWHHAGIIQQQSQLCLLPFHVGEMGSQRDSGPLEVEGRDGGSPKWQQ